MTHPRSDEGPQEIQVARDGKPYSGIYVVEGEAVKVEFEGRTEIAPLAGLDAQKAELLRQLEAGIPAFIELLVNHRPITLRGRSLKEAMGIDERQPARLQNLYQTWRRNPAQMYRAPPTLVFAVIGQARADGQLTPEEESTVLGKLLTHWALRTTLNVSAVCALRQISQPALQKPVGDKPISYKPMSYKPILSLGSGG